MAMATEHTKVDLEEFAQDVAHEHRAEALPGCPQCGSMILEEPLRIDGKDWHQICGAQQAVDLLDYASTPAVLATECEAALSRYVAIRRSHRIQRERKAARDLRAATLEIADAMARKSGVEHVR
jgi:hypothetical protein